MFGKLFESTFEGSMIGAGPSVFALWAYVISKTRDSEIEINPRMVALVLGDTVENVEKSINYLCAEDPNSRTPVENGRRIIKQKGFLYTVVNHAQYRKILNEDDRKEYFRDKKRESRERKKKVSNVKVRKYQMSNMSTHTEAETEAG